MKAYSQTLDRWLERREPLFFHIAVQIAEIIDVVLCSASNGTGTANRVAIYAAGLPVLGLHGGVQTAQHKKLCRHIGTSFPIRYINLKIIFK